MSEATTKDELHAIVESLDESDLSTALTILRGISTSDSDRAQDGTVDVLPQRSGDSDVEPQHPWYDFIGIIDDDGPTDVSENHDKYLADAYMDNHDE